MTDYATVDMVKQRLSGDTPNFSSAWDTVFGQVITEASGAIDREMTKGRGQRGAWSFVADSVATERMFNTLPGARRYLSIDDCVEITAVKIYSPPGTLQQTLALNTDYYPEQASPYVGVYRIANVWPEDSIAAVGVTAKWGYAVTCPYDVRGAVIAEVHRQYLAARSGDDDKIGSHVFGTITLSKAFRRDVQRMLDTYGYGGAQARAG